MRCDASVRKVCRKHHVGGKVYAIDRREVLDMMQRYDVPPIENGGAK